MQIPVSKAAADDSTDAKSCPLSALNISTLEPEIKWKAQTKISSNPRHK